MILRYINQNRNIIIDEMLEISFINSLPSENNILFENNIILNPTQQDNCILFILDKSSSAYNSFVFLMNSEIILEKTNSKIVFTIENKIYTFQTENCQFEIDNNGYITVRSNQNNSTFTLNYYSNENITSNAYQANVTFIDEFSSMPEFSISTFDDSNFTIPRPIRQGVPIISTVPSLINNSSSSAEVSFYNLGKGPNVKTIHFRIICNKIMEDISQNDESLMKLKIYLPNGLDTVKKATYIPMYLVTNDSTNNISIYRTSYDFHTQGYFDGIEYVDGFTQCDVQVPLTVQKVMPFEFDFSLL